MKKLLFFCGLVFSCFAYSGEEDIRKSLHSKFPQMGEIKHLVKTPYSGLYEIVIGDQLLYTDDKGLYLIEGNVIDTTSRRNLSEERRRQLFAVDFSKLPMELALVKVKGNGKRKLAYFTDPNCGYCKKLEQELKQISDVTLYLFLYPIFNGSEEKVQSVWCSKDKIKAWDDLMLNGASLPAGKCNAPIAKIRELGRKHRVSGTPALIFGDGVMVPGYMPAADLEEALNNAAAR